MLVGKVATSYQSRHFFSRRKLTSAGVSHSITNGYRDKDSLSQGYLTRRHAAVATKRALLAFVVKDIPLFHSVLI